MALVGTAGESRQQGVTISVSEGLFYGFYLILTIVKWMGLYEGMKLYAIGVAAAFLFLLCKLETDRYSTRRLVATVLALALGVVTWRLSDKMGALFNIALVVGMAGVNRERLMKVTATAWSVLFALQAFLSLSGIRSTQIFRIHEKLGQYIVRWSMGFTHPNVLHITYFVLIAILMYVYRPQGRRLWCASGLALAGNILIFAYSLSYTGFAITTFYLALNLGLQMMADKRGHASSNATVTAICAAAFAILCMAFAVAGPLVLQGRAFDLVNRALSSRLDLSRQYLLGQGISLLGSANMEVMDGTITIDSAYVYMLVHYGVVYFVLYAVLLVAAIIHYVRRHDRWATAILLTCSLSGITEQYMANTSFKNIAALLIGCMLWERFAATADIVARDWKVTIPEGFIAFRNRIVTAWHRVWSAEIIRKTIACMALALVVGMLAYVSLIQRPSAIYAAPWHCDRPAGDAGEDYSYYDELVADPSFDGWILSNTDAWGKLYEFSGFTADYEYGRRALGAGMALAMAVVVIETGVIAGRERRR